MFDELNKYKKSGNFFFRATDSLTEVSNVPANRYGVYLVYALCKGRVELIYIGRSGVPPKDQQPAAKAKNIVDLKRDIIDGLQFGETERKNAWPIQMMVEDIDALHVHWYVTVDKKNDDLPSYMRTKIMQIYQSIYGKRPRWNSGI
ncbi:hypothetical protein PBAL39_17544 [Pedobacter sp. BAL39]|uniref:hypothetical protein n=1 Tax=Pedobacter sp. BAL39 TaxID=391596 RepID=UPI000155A917|nr:hypothetical protein [Pedobacter sp. BAL39]EDM34262.1 hypothetical protein PBAL39_17544 [Pedobacter sp. BAL39]